MVRDRVDVRRGASTTDTARDLLHERMEMEVVLIAVPTGGVRYYASRNPDSATPRVTDECSRNAGSEEPGITETRARKETE
jgi:hypothetical protein